MPKGPVRRAQLIAPFGVGALMVVRDGTSVVSAGLDHWFEPEDGDDRNCDRWEYVIEEWRLQRLLRVGRFFLPPDHREKRRRFVIPNSGLTVPFLRFPQWHFCPRCYRLYRLPLSMRSSERCEECLSKRKNGYLVQVPFVAMCDCGHMQDFPWQEWVHKTAQPTCSRPMRLIATGGASLAAQKVKCDCGASRTLSSITEAYPNKDMTLLSEKLDKSAKPFTCQGKRPWLGSKESEPCDRPLRGSLRSSSNLYFADTKSSIYLPPADAAAPPELVCLLQQPPLSELITLLSGAGFPIEPKHLRSQQSAMLQRFNDTQIIAALRCVMGQDEAAESATEEVAGDDTQTSFRRSEYAVLRTSRDDKELLTRPMPLDQYESSITRFLTGVVLVHRLRETRALAGFTRVFADNSQTLEQRKSLMWRTPPTGEEAWLPAYIVFGEGVLVELDGNRLAEWEKRAGVVNRVKRLADRYSQVQEKRHLRDMPITPRFVLLHTLSHLLINRLTFECGYSSAALRERLYVSDNPAAPMGGILIYTAAGDAEGTMGGLVRMGKPGNLEPVICRALEEARWCSADPVCMEMGARGGQGPDSCNLAACHNCALVPETACEQFNRFLDRALVVGSVQDAGLAYFEGYGS